MTTTATALSAGPVTANGPEDDNHDQDPGWYDTDRDRVQDDVQRLRPRILAASRDEDHAPATPQGPA
jgi:hypothetical protein